MKTIITLAIASILLVGCSIPKNPKLSWGRNAQFKATKLFGHTYGYTIRMKALMLQKRIVN